jgi:hypothetical protein
MPNFSQINFIILPSAQVTDVFVFSGFWTKNLYAVLISVKRITRHVPCHPYLTAHSTNLLTIINPGQPKAGSDPAKKKILGPVRGTG